MISGSLDLYPSNPQFFIMIDRLARLVIFAYNRPQHLARTLNALASCSEASASNLTIYCDGARDKKDIDAVSQVRDIARAASGFLTLQVIERQNNFGLSASIINGVTTQLKLNDRVIVLEDDILVSPHFLRYMNEGLEMYSEDEMVASIHGYIYPVTTSLPETFFLPGADCWGWATWSRAWEHFRADGAALLSELRMRKLTEAFDIDGAHPFTRMLEDQIAGRNNSWAVRWHASCFLDGMLTLYPGRSLVYNIGNDDSGTHCPASDQYDGEPSKTPIKINNIDIVASQVGKKALKDFFIKSREGFFKRFFKKFLAIQLRK